MTPLPGMNKESLIRCIELQLGRKEVKWEDRFREDLGAESIDMLHIAVAVEKLTGVFIPEEVIPELNTVFDLLSYVNSQTNES